MAAELLSGERFDDNRNYWTDRAPGYSDVNRQELASAQRKRWSDCLRQELSAHFPDRAPSSLRVLEVGTGPGFFAILLCEMGCDVTAVDLTPAMLSEAKENAGRLADRIHFMEMNAEALSFENESFDVVISRNLTWNLPHPVAAYTEWTRVLKPGGLLLNFDANWYSYLVDEAAAEAFALGIAEGGGDFLQAEEEVWRRVWSDAEKLNFASTPLFLLRAAKS